MKNTKVLEGCVFYYFDQHEIKIKKQKIHKIVKIDFFIQNELTNQKKLLNFNNWKNHFYLYENNFELHITEINDDEKILSNNFYKKDNTLLLELQDIKLINLKNYLKSIIPKPTLYVLSIINFYKHLLDSCLILKNKQIFHNYINLESIIVNNNLPLLTDFNYSINLKHPDISNYLKHFIIQYDPTYIEWPIELHILSYLLTNKLESLSSYNIEIIIK